MFLKRLEIQGFKSFSEKIKLDFKKEITAIVGPNGSGKSNISDAIRWVLGEQSAKTLRGEKMEDIIFAGTKNRKPLGFAEVSITLDNTDKKLNLDYSEITITRKVFRSGESGYYINKTPCRLKDIHELFMDTGIGKEGYAIIGQGKIDAILNNKYEERRAIFEEAVGIIKFKNRKIQAENKLEEVRKNLIRTNDIISELENQIAPLKIQKEKANEFLKLENELKLIKVNLFKIDYENFEKNIKEIEKNIEILNQNIKNLEIEKLNNEKKQLFLKEKLNENEALQQKLNTDISNIMLNIEQQENNIKLDLKNIEFIEKEIQRIKKDKLSFSENIKTKIEEIDFIKISLNAKNFELDAKENNLKNLLNKFEIIKQENFKQDELIKKYNTEIIEKMSIISKLNTKLDYIKNNKKLFQQRKNNILEEKNLINSKLNEKNVKKDVLVKKLENLIEKEQNYNENLEKLNFNFKNLELSISENNTLYLDKLKLFEQIKEKNKLLNELEKDYEGYLNSVKFILKEKEFNTDLNGIYGAVGELIKVEKAYETAIEVALGNSIQNIITKTEDDAKLAIKYLKNNKKGRATFLPISSIKPRKIADLDSLKKEQGFIDIANNLIYFEKTFENIFSSLLGKIVVIDNMENGTKIAKKYNYSFKIVTLEGDIISRDGSLTGGSFFKKNTNIFSRNRQIQENEKLISNLQTEIDNILQLNETSLNQKNDIILKIKDAKNNIENNFKLKTSIEAEIFQNDLYIKDINEKLKLIENEEVLLNKQTDFSEEETIFNELNQMENNLQIIKSNLLKFENDFEKEKQNKELIFNQINDLKLDITHIKNEISNFEKNILRLNQEISNSEKNKTTFEEEILQKTFEKDDINLKISNKNKNINDLKNDYQNLKLKYNELIEEKYKISQNIQDFGNSLLNIIQNINEIDNQIIKNLSKKENFETKIENSINNMWEKYQITYAEACNDFQNLNLNYEKLKEKEKQLNKKINSLGFINVAAIEEYEIVKKRYELNISQKNDILKADEDLQNIIKNLMIEMENQFKNQFDLINKNFGEVFSKIFGGGTAKLTLSDEKNALSSGIDIVAQPPGKNLQSLTLLSGGERTLTAMSLLFAILIMKPSPFCILDETEAALDDANVNRYANFLKKFSKDTQFILITHKTGTMEIANVLYGVTMEEQGISKVISVELKEAKQYDGEKERI